jgi:phosphohistidine phosphatase
MTRTLILMRHAKSSWDSLGVDDHDRALNGRGRQSAAALGKWLRVRGWHPDEVLCSTARRTRETLDGLDLDCHAEFVTGLYLADAAAMRRVLDGAQGRTVLMIGHNPGIAELAEVLTRTPPAHDRFYDYPTGATTVLRFDCDDWAGIGAHSGELVDFIVPRDLPET